MSENNEPKVVDKLEENELYTVSIKFTSVGEGNQVVPDITYSHRFVDEYKGEYPASYLLARDTLMMLNVMSTMHNTADNDAEYGEFLTPEELMIAAEEAEKAREDDTPPTIN